MFFFKKGYSDYQVQDFLRDESYIDWVRSGKSPEQIWFSRLQQFPEIHSAAREAETLIDRISSLGLPTDTQRIDQLKHRIDTSLKNIRAKEQFGRYRPKPRKNLRPYGIAAAVSLVLATAAVMFLAGVDEWSTDKHADTSETEEIRNTKDGQKLMVHLNDGSKVRLNSGSTIRYRKYFSDHDRVIELEGEAFFEVARDPDRPFYVMAGNTVTRAIGTSFNIFTKKESTAISLVTGKVSVTTRSKQDKELFLSPGEKVHYQNDTFGTIIASGYEDIAWKDDVLLFKRSSSKEVFEKLARWYGVQFEFETEFKGDWNYSGRFDNESLRLVLQSIGYAESFSFEITKNKVLIKK